MQGPGRMIPTVPPKQMPEEMDGKTALNQFCQKYCQRPLTKDDIAYTTNKFGVQYQAIVRLACLQGEQYAGETRLNPKDAEKSAAQQALTAHAQDAAALPSAAMREAQKKQAKSVRLREQRLVAEGGAAPAEGLGLAAVSQAENPAITPKVQLNTMCMKIAQRYLKKGETAYTTQQVLGGYQATVQLSCLPDDWANRVWAGEVSASKREAEQSVAAIALAQIVEDSELSEIANRPRVPKGGGKGGLKGADGFYKGGKAWSWASWAWLAGKGKGGLGPELPREAIPTELVGEVINWKPGERHGWIKASNPIEHPSASMRDGRIYVNVKDMKGEKVALSEGTKIRFRVYEDSQGLGAEDVEAI